MLPRHLHKQQPMYITRTAHTNDGLAYTTRRLLKEKTRKRCPRQKNAKQPAVLPTHKKKTAVPLHESYSTLMCGWGVRCEVVISHLDVK